MASSTELVNVVAVALLQGIKEGLQTGRIPDVDAARNEVEAAITQLGRAQIPEDDTSINVGLVGRLLLDIGTLRQEVMNCQTRLAEVQSQATSLRADVESSGAVVPSSPPPYRAPPPSPADFFPRPAPPRTASVFFPGGTRTITIHPPDSPSYESVIYDARGDVIIDFRRPRPFRREGAFIGPEVDWVGITRVNGRGPELPDTRVAPPAPHWPGRSQPYIAPPRLHTASDIIPGRRRPSSYMRPGLRPFGRTLSPEHPSDVDSPFQPTGRTLSSSASSREAQLSLSAENAEASTTPCSTPPSPSIGKGRKRALDHGENEGSRDQLIEQCIVVGKPVTPTPVKCEEESHAPQGPSRRKKPRSSVSSEGASASQPLFRTRSVLDLARTA